MLKTIHSQIFLPVNSHGHINTVTSNLGRMEATASKQFM